MRGPKLELPSTSTSDLVCSRVFREPSWDSVVILIFGKGPGTEDSREQGPFSVALQHLSFSALLSVLGMEKN